MRAVQQQKNCLDEDGMEYIEYPVQRIMKEFRCSERTAIRILEELDSQNGIGLIEKKRQGRGLPNRIYLKRFKRSTKNNWKVGSKMKRLGNGTKKKMTQLVGAISLFLLYQLWNVLFTGNGFGKMWYH